MKKLIITIDSEGDNLWNYMPGKPIITSNSKYVPRFQELCEKYNYKPTYLVDFEMANSIFFIEYTRQRLVENKCEIGMHMHAWNTPPIYPLSIRRDIKPGDCAFVYEYPIPIIDEKIKIMTDLIVDKWEGYRPVSHRSGRWAINMSYADLLLKKGYRFDCSVCPGIKSLDQGFSENSIGPDYTKSLNMPFCIKDRNGLIEIPLTVIQNHFIKNDGNDGWKHMLYKYYRAVRGRGLMSLRPGTAQIEDMIRMTDKILDGPSDYIMFMLHTSEMMPGGSPKFKTQYEIDKMYDETERLFDHMKYAYEGCTLREYGEMIQRKKLPIGTINQ